MEKKKNIWDSNSLWTFFSHRKLNCNFFWRAAFTKLLPLNAFIKKNNGFTLIEILIAVVLIGIMAAGLVVVLDPLAQIQKARDANRKSDLSQIKNALEIYYQDNGRYPAATDFKITRLDASVADWGQQFQPYMSVLPKDPSSSKNYVYNATLDGQTYYIYASLDRGANDPQVCNKGLACSSLPGGASCGTETCNYGVSSPNVSP